MNEKNHYCLYFKKSLREKTQNVVYRKSDKTIRCKHCLEVLKNSELHPKTISLIKKRGKR